MCQDCDSLSEGIRIGLSQLRAILCLMLSIRFLNVIENN